MHKPSFSHLSIVIVCVLSSFADAGANAMLVISRLCRCWANPKMSMHASLRVGYESQVTTTAAAQD